MSFTLVFSFIALGILSKFIFKLWRKQALDKRAEYIDNFQFPSSLSDKLLKEYPHLSAADSELVLKALREYFHICNIAGRKIVAMPSQAVDFVWHEFILFTRNYQRFCRSAFSRFLHHTPAEAMDSPTSAQLGIKRAWKIACQREALDPKKATQLPLLFALDVMLKIPDGFHYSLNCQGQNKQTFCASHIGCDSGCSSGCGGDSSSCSSGCGGGD